MTPTAHHLNRADLLLALSQVLSVSGYSIIETRRLVELERLAARTGDTK